MLDFNVKHEFQRAGRRGKTRMNKVSREIHQSYRCKPTESVLTEDGPEPTGTHVRKKVTA